MPRLLGVDIPNEKKVCISLTYLYGVGPFVARELCERTGINPEKKARELDEDELSRLSTLLERDFTVEGPLRRQTGQSIHLSLPCRGQRTKTNARTRKGPRKTVAGKKGVKDLR